MGEHNVGEADDDAQRRTFVKALLDDVHALEQMLDNGMFETGVRRIGAEQEMFLIDASMSPSPVAPQVLANTDDPRLTTELARFNLEANLSPRIYGGDCLRAMEDELIEVMGVARTAARSQGARVLLTGILPTLRKAHLGLDNMTPAPRYHALNRAMARLRGDAFHVLIKGLDELETTHDNVMLEACNASFQIHFQVAPEEFARLYNVAQAVTAPVLAAAVNSPLLLGHRLWSETRVALFERSVDVRSPAHQARGLRSRVSFGDGWIKESVLEIFREDIALFRVLLGHEVSDRPFEDLAAGRPPPLTALRLHNGTVYRWNRPCYGVVDGVAHLRIENRVLPAGPTVADEVATAAFYFGLMSGMTEAYDDIAAVMRFDDAKNNFFAAARHGLETSFRWVGGEVHTAQALILDQLLPLADKGLRSAGVDSDDIARYLGIVEARVASGRTGAQWMLNSLEQMPDDVPRDARDRRLCAAMWERQMGDGAPVHTWGLCGGPGDEDDAAFKESFRTVGQIMTTALHTVRREDLVDLAASLMDWQRIRHVPVEDDEGRLVGLVSHRQLLRMVARGHMAGAETPQLAVGDVMREDPVTVSPQMPTLEAMHMMRAHKVGSLPVVEDGKLVGIVTEQNLIDVSARLLERYLAD
ncbi:MAG: CBS domain-containing protein [Nannocystaceae bacterium]|nr:CBS domain-containing protein [Nannocystaceae bacterium]